jgi:hypothetical protein
MVANVCLISDFSRVFIFSGAQEGFAVSKFRFCLFSAAAQEGFAVLDLINSFLAKLLNPKSEIANPK